MSVRVEVDSAILRRQVADDWDRRFQELVKEHQQAVRTVDEALAIAADAVAELARAARASAAEAPLFYRRSRALPFRPGLIVENFKAALRARGLRVND